MPPKDIEELDNPTEGERKVFRFLREAARPDSEFIGWYEPAIGEQGLEPDFVLFRKHHGLLVLEKKERCPIDSITGKGGTSLHLTYLNYAALYSYYLYKWSQALISIWEIEVLRTI